MTQDATTPTGESEIDRLRREVAQVRHELLLSRDQVIGSDAEVGRANRDLTRLAQELRTTTRKLRRTTARRDELQQRLDRSRKRQEEQVARLRSRVAQLEDELSAARHVVPATGGARRAPAAEVSRARAGSSGGAPLFSIVTPVFDPPIEVLEATIASVLAQEHRDWEWILVDDASTDPHVVGTITRHMLADDRIRLLERDVNGHIVAASNDGIDAARGEFMVLLDHDDLLTPDALEVNARWIAEHDDVDYLYSDEDKVDDRGRTYGRVRQARLVARAAARPDVHLPPVRDADVGRARGRGLPRGLRRVAGPRPGAPRHRGGPPGRARPRGPLPLAGGRRLGRGDDRRQALRRRRRAAVPCRTTSTGTGVGGRVEQGAGPAATSSTGDLDPGLRVSIVIPTTGRATWSGASAG